MSAIGKIQVDLIANSGQFTAAMKGAAAQAETFGRKFVSLRGNVAAFGGMLSTAVSKIVNLRTALVGAAAAFGAFKLVGTLDAAAEKIDQIGKASKRLGMSVEQLSALRFAAGESGIEFENLAKMASKAGKSVAELVAQGAGDTKLGRLTVRLTDAAGQVRNIADLLPDLARGIESAGSEAEQIRLAQKFFGKGGGDEFVTLLKESGTFVKGLAEQTERARKLGVIFTSDQVEKLTAYRDAVGRVHEAWLGLKVRLMTDVAPALTKFLDDLALRTAAIPKLVGAIRNAIGLAGGGVMDPAAAAALDRLIGATLNLFTTTVSESAQLFVRIIVEGLRNVGANMAVAFGMKFREVLPDWMLNDTWFSPGDPMVGSEKRLRDLIGQRAALLDLQRRVLAGESSVHHVFDRRMGESVEVPGSRTELADELRRMVRDILGQEGSVDQAVEVIDKMTRASRFALSLNAPKGEIAAEIAAAVALESAKRLKGTLDEAAANLRTAWADLGAAMGGMQEGFGTPEFVGPPEPPKVRFGAIFVGFRELVDGAKETGRRIGEGLGGGMEEFGKRAVKAWENWKERGQDALKAAQAIRFELYPEEKLEHDIAGIRALREELLKLGLGAALTEEAVAAMIAKIIESGKQKSEEVRNLANDMRDAIQGFAGDAAQAFVDFAVDAKGSLGDLAKSWAKTLLAMATQALIFKPLFDSLGVAFGDWFGTTTLGKTSTAPASAMGNVFADGRLLAFAGGGVVGGPTLFPMARGMGLMGEAGPEAVMPLQRIGGRLGVNAAGGGVMVQIIDQRGSGARPQVSEGRGPDGRKLISVLIRDEVKGMFRDGSLDRDMAANYGPGRRGTAR